MLDPIKPAYNHGRLDGQLKLTANTFIRLWISMPVVLVAVPELLCRTCCILYQLSPLLLTIFWILWCTDRWQRQMHRKSVWMPPSPNYWCPHFYHCPILCWMPFLLQPSPVYPGLGHASNNAGLHTQWLGFFSVSSVKYAVLVKYVCTCRGHVCYSSKDSQGCCHCSWWWSKGEKLSLYEWQQCHHSWYCGTVF